MKPCNGCTACCEVLAVKDLGKPFYQRCEHCNSGCSMYSTRPQACRMYECCYTVGLVSQPPNVCGLLFTMEDPDVLDVYEVHPGALFSLLEEDLYSAMHGLGATSARFYCYGSKIATAFTVKPPYKNLGLDYGTRHYLATGNLALYTGSSPCSSATSTSASASTPEASPSTR